MKKATMAIAALLALILGCSDVLDVSPEEWAQNTERIEEGSEALREYVGLMRDLETSAKRVSELNADVFGDDEFDADEFTKTNDAIVSGITAQAKALRELADAMSDVNAAMKEADAIDSVAFPRASGDVRAAGEKQRECYYAVMRQGIYQNSSGAYAEIGRVVLQFDPTNMEVIDRRMMTEILTQMGGDVEAACDDYIYGGR